jgi:hypothetical protein
MIIRSGLVALSGAALALLAPGLSEAQTRAAPTAAVAAALKRPAPPPLTPSERAQAVARLLKRAPPTSLPAPISVSPGASYKDGVTMGFSYAYTVGGSASGGLAMLMSDYNGAPTGLMTLQFHAQPGRAYIIDCRTKSGANVDIAMNIGGGGPLGPAGFASVSNGHFVWALFAQPTGADVLYEIRPSDQDVLIITGCELTTI